jgi:transposase
MIREESQMPGPPAVPVRMTIKRERKLRQIINAGTIPQRLVLRARIVMAAAAGDPNAKIARDLGCTENTVRQWRGRFARQGIRGIFDKRRPGRRETHGPSARLAVVATATSVPPDGESCWSQAMIARHLGGRGLAVSRATVGRVLADAHVRPHKVRGWLNRADDPQFWIQAGAVCRLYLHPEPGTVLISIDEKTGIQAKTRRHPDVPAAPGRDARREFEYVRHGTVSIIAAMNVSTGQVISQRIRKNDSVTFMKFLAMLDQHTAPGLRIRLIMDNGSSHTSRATRAWIKAHPRKTWRTRSPSSPSAATRPRTPGNGSTTPTLSTPGTSSATPRKRPSPRPPDTTGRGKEPLRDRDLLPPRHGLSSDQRCL